MFRALQSSDTGEARFEVDGQTFEHPPRLVQIREEQWISDEDRLSEPPDAARAIEMEDVGQLVGDDERVPVIVVAQS